MSISAETNGTSPSAASSGYDRLFRDGQSWVWLAALLAGVYAFRHYSTFTERALMWDDFLFFGEAATMPRFYQTLLYTFLHFTPLLRLSVFGMFHLVPLHLLPAATSVWNVFWVCCLAVGFLRLARIYGISPVAALLGITFILFNPLFAEVQIWYIETFNLIALVFIVEGLVQLEKAVTTDRTFHWVASALLSILASCAWSSGYYVGLFYATVVYFERARLERPWKALTILAVAFLTYPALKTLGMHLCGGTVQDVTPWTPGKLMEALSYIVGHGLLFGSLGLWGTPQAPIKVPKPLWIPATIFLTAAIVVLGLKKEWRKHAAISLIAIYVGLAVPVYFRGTQFSYDDFRWFIRYFTKPVFGMGLFVSIVAHLALQRFRHAWLGVSAFLVLMAVVSFVNKMPEHYVGGNPGRPALSVPETAGGTVAFFGGVIRRGQIPRSRLSAFPQRIFCSRGGLFSEHQQHGPLQGFQRTEYDAAHGGAAPGPRPGDPMFGHMEKLSNLELPVRCSGADAGREGG